MSHDRGCPCGLERYEYLECTDKDCTRRRLALKKKEIKDDIVNRRNRSTSISKQPKLPLATKHQQSTTAATVTNTENRHVQNIDWCAED